jgi:hypothetical protein
MAPMLTLSRKEMILLAELDRRQSTAAGELAHACGLTFEETTCALCMLRRDRLVGYDEMGEQQIRLWHTTRRGRDWLLGGQQLAVVDG